MTNSDLMSAWLGEASSRLAEARELLTREQFHRTVRLCQESSEFALKALLVFAEWMCRRSMPCTGWSAGNHS